MADHAQDSAPTDAPLIPDDLYSEPDWASMPGKGFYLEVLKQGIILGKIPLKDRSFFHLGRVPGNHIVAEHGSISRYHMVLQFGNDNFFYVYDLGSTHGTKINKAKTNPKRYYRLRIGQMFRPGESTRLYVLQGPASAEAEEERRLALLEQDLVEAKEQKEKQFEEQNQVWGLDGKQQLADDMIDDTELMTGGGDAALLSTISSSFGSDAVTTSSGKDPYYVKDPKKALKAFFDRYGEDPDFNTEQVKEGKMRLHMTTVELPLPTLSGNPIIVAGETCNKAKDAIVSCCLKACQMLDLKGILRDSEVAKQKRVRVKEENEEDEFYDRTGTIQRKRSKQLTKQQRAKQQVETYESLSVKRSDILARIAKLEAQIEAKLAEASKAAPSEEGDVDDYMKVLAAETARKQAKQLSKDKTSLQLELKDVEEFLKVVKPDFESLVPSKHAKGSGMSSSEVERAAVSSGKAAHASTMEPAIDATSDQRGEQPEQSEAALLTKAKADYEAKLARKRQAKQLLTNADDDDNDYDKQSRVERLKAAMATADVPPVTTDDGEHEACDTGVAASAKRTKPSEPPVAAKRPKAHPAIEQAVGPTKLQPEGFGTEAYDSWKPPTNQTGDGRTSLNDKLGY